MIRFQKISLTLLLPVHTFFSFLSFTVSLFFFVLPTSTNSNLMELVLVRQLCGTFCFSMQFVVLLECDNHTRGGPHVPTR
jgi:hypothetical protein